MSIRKDQDAIIKALEAAGLHNARRVQEFVEIGTAHFRVQLDPPVLGRWGWRFEAGPYTVHGSEPKLENAVTRAVTEATASLEYAFEFRRDQLEKARDAMVAFGFPIEAEARTRALLQSIMSDFKRANEGYATLLTFVVDHQLLPDGTSPDLPDDVRALIADGVHAWDSVIEKSHEIYAFLDPAEGSR